MGRHAFLGRTALLVLAACAGSGVPAHAGVTGNSYSVTGYAELPNTPPQIVTGCARFGADQSLDLTLRGEGLVVTRHFEPYSEVDFLLFGIWSIGGSNPVVSGIHLWFGTFVIAGPNQLYMAGELSDCTPRRRMDEQDAGTSSAVGASPVPDTQPSAQDRECARPCETVLGRLDAMRTDRIRARSE